MTLYAVAIQRLLPVARKTAAKPDLAQYREWLMKAEARLVGLLKRQERIQCHVTHWTRKQNTVAGAVDRTRKRVAYLRKQLNPLKGV